MRTLALLVCAGSLMAAPSTVKEDNYPLRQSCSETAAEVTRLKQGEPVKIRFALLDNGRSCYAVTIEREDQKLQGYVWADGLTSLEEFEKARRVAPSRALPAMTRGVNTTRPVAPRTQARR